VLGTEHHNMTTARCNLMPPGQSGTFHIVARCVRRSFLWGFDSYSNQNYDHCKPWIEQRILLLSDAFAVSLLSYERVPSPKLSSL